MTTLPRRPGAIPRWLSLAALVALGGATAAGCATNDEPTTDTDVGSASDDITQVNHSKVKRQSIGNCWIYATSGWLESLNKEATGQEKNTSESWTTYWHWFDQITNGQAGSELQTGGFWLTAINLVLRYGIVMEGDFIAGEADDEMSNRQASALAAVNESLKSGALKDPAARRDRKLVRKELDRAWQLDASNVQKLDTVFGQGVERTLDRSYAARAPGNGVVRAKDFPVKLKDPQTGQKVDATLADAIGTGSSFWGPRQGKLAWNSADYPSDARSRRDFWKRVQRALHDNFPVIIAWKVDFNALTSDSRFSIDELKRRGPGRQGGHMVLLYDYQAENVPGFGKLAAGQQATAEQMKAALADETKISFMRIKNSWGGIRPDRWQTVAGLPGYHDLEMTYLDGPIKECTEVNGTSDPSDCPREVVPLWDAVLPAGY
ncbi:MAG: hypothetical protein JST00_06895 [Deltaproteobacteria bacterium]|nr:hypothetical protein [Deltaproteobacteria bacterium]